jgi:hypothetical protein
MPVLALSPPLISCTRCFALFQLAELGVSTVEEMMLPSCAWESEVEPVLDHVRERSIMVSEQNHEKQDKFRDESYLSAG